jgi:diguanylate cyclase (GGDEF)-like protein
MNRSAKAPNMLGKKRFSGKRRPVTAIDTRQFEDLRVFHDVARALTSTLELEPLLRASLSLMEQFLGPEQWTLMMYDEEAKDLYYALSSRMDESKLEGLRIKMGEGIAGYVAQTGVPLVIPDVYADADWRKFAEAHPELHLTAIACMPIRHSKRTLGVLQIYNSTLDLMPDASISFLRVLCDYAAIAMENTRQVRLVHHLSITDDCTGLFNSRYLYTMLEQEITALSDPQVISIQPHFSLVFLDLDYFKTVNDKYGHLVGSRLLAEVGGLIKRALGPEHAGFRYGGDEFVALLRGQSKAAALELVTRLREELNETHFLGGDDAYLAITASFGLATFPEDGANLHAIIRSADTMMYKAKADGRDRISVADPEHPQEFVSPKTSRHS